MGPQKDLTLDDDLILAIQKSTDKQIISETELPGASRDLLVSEYYDEVTLEAMIAPDLGFEVFRSGVCEKSGKISELYFDLDGRKLCWDDENKTADDKSGYHRGDKWSCFEMVFPLSLSMADGSTITVSANDESGWAELKTWYNVNPEITTRPEMVYPVSIIYTDDSVVILESEAAMHEAKSECVSQRGGGKGRMGRRGFADRPEAGDRRGGQLMEQTDDGNGRRFGHRDERRCFEFVFPITHVMPDGSLITIEDPTGFTSIRAWYAEHPDTDERPQLQFPVDIIFEDATTASLENEADLTAARESCAGDDQQGGHGHGDRPPGGGNNHHADCFDFVFPVIHLMPDGSLIIAEDEAGLAEIGAWYAAHPDSREPAILQYPVTIVYEDGSTVTLADHSEMAAARAACDDDNGNGGGNGGGGDHGGGHHDNCFQLVFPFTHIMPDGSFIIIEDETGFAAVRAWYAEHPDTNERPQLQYPVDIMYSDGTSVTILDTTAMLAAREACDEDDDNGGGDRPPGGGNRP